MQLALLLLQFVDRQAARQEVLGDGRIGLAGLGRVRHRSAGSDNRLGCQGGAQTVELALQRAQNRLPALVRNAGGVPQLGFGEGVGGGLGDDVLGPADRGLELAGIDGLERGQFRLGEALVALEEALY